MKVSEFCFPRVHDLKNVDPFWGGLGIFGWTVNVRGKRPITAGTDGRVGPGQLSLRGDVFGLGSGELTAYRASLAYQFPF